MNKKQIITENNENLAGVVEEWEGYDFPLSWLGFKQASNQVILVTPIGYDYHSRAGLEPRQEVVPVPIPLFVTVEL